MIFRRKIFKIIIPVLFIGIIIGVTSINHPIILKWLTGTARIIGKPVKVETYINGVLNEKIKVFHTDKYWNNEPADYYILYSSDFHKRTEFFCVNKSDNYVGCPSGSNELDYDIVGGFLFQSEVGSKFTPFQDDIKGLNFKPNLKISKNEIILDLPPSDKNAEIDILKLVFNN